MSVTLFANMFSQAVGCLFILFMVSFAEQKLLNLTRSYLFIFVLISITLEDRSKKILLQCMSKSLLPTFSPRNFIVSYVTFRSLLHFEFIFVYDVREFFNSFFYMRLSSFPSTAYWRDCLFSTVYSSLLCHKLADHKCMHLSLGFLFYF